MNPKKNSRAVATFVLLMLTCSAGIVVAQQKVLLIGTQHQTPEAKIVQIQPVREAVREFKPEIICTEYRKPNDSVSIRYLYGKRHFKKQDSIRKAWKIQPRYDTKRIGELMTALKKQDNLFLRMELRNIFFVRSDFGNSDYQAFLILKRLERDSSKVIMLRKQFPMFEEMRAIYRSRAARYDEYTYLVFPLAKELGITYLNPIDDQSTNVSYEKHFSRLHQTDTIQEDSRLYRDRISAFRNRMSSLPSETNEWVYANSPEMIEDLKYVEGYKVDLLNTSNDVKMLSYFWILRNKKMATYIDQVMKKNPGKRVVAFFGASHVGPIQEELKKISKKHQIQTLYDLIN